MPLKILFEDATLQVVDKPAGMPVEEIEGLSAHRLDKDTSGALVVAKTQEALEFLQQQFQERRVEKTYTCLVSGSVKKDKGIIEAPLGRSPADRRKHRAYPIGDPKGKRDATTEYSVLKRYDGYTLLQIKPRTGRKHQIRAHLASLGHPVAGDNLYGFKNQKTPVGLERQFLHASSITLQIPSGEKKTFTSKLPEDLQRVIEALNHANKTRDI